MMICRERLSGFDAAEQVEPWEESLDNKQTWVSKHYEGWHWML
jgi:hypothetical protein